jgi:hypothetical protein
LERRRERVSICFRVAAEKERQVLEIELTRIPHGLDLITEYKGRIKPVHILFGLVTGEW